MTLPNKLPKEFEVRPALAGFRNSVNYIKLPEHNVEQAFQPVDLFGRLESLPHHNFMHFSSLWAFSTFFSAEKPVRTIHKNKHIL
jgi:hypothetical protein